jgi:hypothetical protein
MPLLRYRGPKIARLAVFDHMNDCDLEIQSCGWTDQVADGWSAVPIVHKRNWLRRNPITTLLDPSPTNKLQRASLSAEASLYPQYHRALPRLSSVTRALRSRRDQKAVKMSNISKFSIREWLVPPVLLPVFFVLLIAAAMLIQW